MRPQKDLNPHLEQKCALDPRQKICRQKSLWKSKKKYYVYECEHLPRTNIKKVHWIHPLLGQTMMQSKAPMRVILGESLISAPSFWFTVVHSTPWRPLQELQTSMIWCFTKNWWRFLTLRDEIQTLVSFLLFYDAKGGYKWRKNKV